MRVLTASVFVTAVAALAAWGATSSPPLNLGKALEAQKALAATRTNDAQVLNDLGNLQLLAGQKEEAEASYRQALKINEDLTSARYNLALLLQQQGRRRAAISEFKRVVRAEPENAWAHYQLGSLHELSGDTSAAIDHYSRSFALNPQLSFAEVNPQVIDSELLTESLLQAYRHAQVAPPAPRQYEEPGRIVSLLVPARVEPTETPAPEAAPASPGGGTAVTTPKPSAARPAAQPRTQSPDVGGSRVLTPQDLEPDTGVNQAPAGGGSPTKRGGTRGVAPEPNTPAWNRPENDPPRYTPPPPPPASGERLRFVPPVDSTGRLETRTTPELVEGRGGR